MTSGPPHVSPSPFHTGQAENESVSLPKWTPSLWSLLRLYIFLSVRVHVSNELEHPGIRCVFLKCVNFLTLHFDGSTTTDRLKLTANQLAAN